MPEAHQAEFESFMVDVKDLVKRRDAVLQTEAQLRARVLAMQQAGMLLPDCDPLLAAEQANEMGWESLR